MSSNSDIVLKAIAVGGVATVGCAIGRWLFLIASNTPEQYFHEAIAIECVWVAPLGAIAAMLLSLVFLQRERGRMVRYLKAIAKRRNLPASTIASFTEVLDVLREEEQ